MTQKQMDIIVEEETNKWIKKLMEQNNYSADVHWEMCRHCFERGVSIGLSYKFKIKKAKITHDT